ncbi:MAG: ABC transporter substrate-binding protein [Wolbachia endosymbiont of Tyrophagus putrescentiae]|nr:ABC transporter substrate-binding protein [Wolbachia endosymbiont of Tyrophagus putrescentiae]
MKIIKTLAIIICIAISSHSYAHYENYKTLIYTLKQQVQDTLAENGNKEEKVQKIIQNSVNLRKISQFVMGKHWTLTTEEKRENFIKEYETHFIRLCIKILCNCVNSGEMTIMGVKKLDDGVFLVNTRFSYNENEEFTNIDFKVIENDGSPLIDDIVMSGISISINQRSLFNGKIDAYGIEHVIEELRYSNNL